MSWRAWLTYNPNTDEENVEFLTDTELREGYKNAVENGSALSSLVLMREICVRWYRDQIDKEK